MEQIETNNDSQELKKEKAPVLEISEETKRELAELFAGAEVDGEKIPPISVKLFSGRHATEEDALGIIELLKDTDIFVPEAYGWSEKRLSAFRDISEGVKEPPKRDNSDEDYKYDNDEFGRAIFKALYGSNKQVMMIDIPAEKTDRDAEFSEEEYRRKLVYEQPDMERAANIFAENVAIDAEIITKEREEHMLSVFALKLKELVNEHPELKQKKEIRILMTLGSAHSALYHELKKVGEKKVERKYRYSPMVHEANDELHRRIVFGKEVSQELKIRVLFEEMIFKEFGTCFFIVFKDAMKARALSRYFASLFTENEMKEIYLEWKKEEELDKDYEKRFEIWLKKKGIKIPRNEKEVDEILKKQN